MGNARAEVDLDRAVTDRLRTDDLDPPAAAEADFLSGRTDRWIGDEPTVHPAVRARALVVSNRPDEAIEVLESLVGCDFTPQALAAASWAVSRVSCPGLTASLPERVGALAGGFVTDDGLPLGPGSSLVALVASAEGDIEKSLDFHDRGVLEGDRRAPVWGAIARLERSRVLLSDMCLRDDAADPAAVRESARRSLVSASTFFASSGHAHLAHVTASLMELCGPGPDDGYRYNNGEGVAEPALGYLRSGERCLAGFGVQPPVVVRHRKGIGAIRYLIANRHRQVPAVELDQVLAGPGSDAGGGAGVEVLEELQALRTDPAHDPEQLSEHLRAIVFDDRVRSRVSKLLRRTISALGDEHPLLGEHLRVSVRTGFTCSYEAPPIVRWIL